MYRVSGKTQTDRDAGDTNFQNTHTPRLTQLMGVVTAKICTASQETGLSAV